MYSHVIQCSDLGVVGTSTCDCFRMIRFSWLMLWGRGKGEVEMGRGKEGGGKENKREKFDEN